MAHPGVAVVYDSFNETTTLWDQARTSSIPWLANEAKVHRNNKFTQTLSAVTQL